MITDPKEIKEFYSIPDTVTNPDEFKSWFNETFIRKDKIAVDKELRNSIAGAALGTEMTNIKRFFKDNGIEFSDDEIKSIEELKSHKNEAMIAEGFKKLQGIFANEKLELEKKAGTGGDERVKTLEDSITKLKAKLTETDSAWKATATELETERKNGAARLREHQINTLLSERRKGVKLKQKLTQAEQLGWESGVEKRLKFELNETGDDLDVFNAKGERIVNKNKAGTFLNATEALQELANEMDLAEVNPHGGKQIQTQQYQTQKPGTQSQDTGEQGRTIIKHGKVVKI